MEVVIAQTKLGFSDVSNSLMAVNNLIGLLLVAIILKVTHEHFGKERYKLPKYW